MSYIEVNGAHLEYIEAGRGAPVLFVHGSLDDMRSWRYQMEPFSQHYQAIAFSRRYHYPNQWTGDGSDYSAELHANDLAAVIRGLDIAPVHLVTSSYGGNVALYMAQQEPELVRTLVLGEPPLLPWLETIPGGPPLRQAFLDQAWLPARAACEAGQLEDGVRLFLDGVMGRPTFQHLTRRGHQMMMDNAPEMRAETLSDRYFPPFDCSDAAMLPFPVLLLTGELSPRLFHLITDELARCLPDSRVVTIPRASHAIHVGNHTAYNEAVLGFLAERAPSPPIR
jgi:pimeloyl-ACP methyl ester carboxylesterase